MKEPILPKNVIYILEKLNKYGYEAYIVGGCVRDCILDKTPKDWDITTSAKPLEVKGIFSHTYDTGILHGTVTVLEEGEGYEVTTYRIDGEYGDCRHPSEVFFTGDLKEDLRRRDFTMNAIAYHPKHGYIDPYNGKVDIQNKIIRGVGCAEERFKEDALRMLRAVRFAAQTGFEIENATWDAIIQNKELIKKISVERIKEEIQKLILSENIEKLPLLWESELLGEIWYNLGLRLPEVCQNIIFEIKKLPKRQDLRWAALLEVLGDNEAVRFMKHMKFDTKTIKTVESIILQSKKSLPKTAYELKKYIQKMGIYEFSNLLEFLKARDAEEVIYTEKIFLGILENKEPIFTGDLAIDGKQIISLGINPGKKIGKTLAVLLDEVQNDPEKNTQEFLTEYVKNHFGL